MAQGPSQSHPLGDPPLSCARCGACCQSDEPAYIRLFSVDLERLGDAAAALSAAGPAGPEMRFDGGRCIALALPSGEHAPSAGTAACTIHAERPDACRWLVPGSGACRQARARLALPPLDSPC